MSESDPNGCDAVAGVEVIEIDPLTGENLCSRGGRWVSRWHSQCRTPPANYTEEPDAAVGDGAQAWLFAGSEVASNRAAVVMSLVQPAKLHDTTRGPPSRTH